MTDYDQSPQPRESRIWWLAILCVLFIFALGFIHVLHHAKPFHRPQASDIPDANELGPITDDSGREITFDQEASHEPAETPQRPINVPEAPFGEARQLQSGRTVVARERAAPRNEDFHARRRFHHFRIRRPYDDPSRYSYIPHAQRGD